MHGYIKESGAVRDNVAHLICKSYDDILNLPEKSDSVPFGSDCYVIDEDTTLWMLDQWALKQTTVYMPLPSTKGEILSGSTVTLTCATSGASIYYTTNGDTPTSGSTAYSAPIEITADTTLKAIAIKDAASSLVMTANYTIPQTETPLVLPLAGEYLIGQELTMTSTVEGAEIYYTTDGSAPDATDNLYDPDNKPTLAAAGTIKAVAVVDGYANSDAFTVAYTISKAATPVATPAAGAVADDSEVVLTTATTGAAIYYTIDGSTPDASKTLYEAPIVITDAVTIKAIAIHVNYTNSAVLTAAYTIAE